MSLEKLLQNTRGLIFAASLIGCGTTLPSLRSHIPPEQRTQQEIGRVLSSVESDVPLFTSLGAIATGLSNITRASEEEIQHYGYKPITFTLPDDTIVRALYKPGKKDFPFIIGTFGFLSDKRAHASHNFMKIMADSPLFEYNILIVDHPSSAPFYCDNGEVSWGGIEEGYFLTEIAAQLKQQYQAKSVHLVGISMGGMGVIQAAYRGKGIIDSAIAFSPVTDYTDVPGDTLREIREESFFGPSFFSVSGEVNELGLGQLVDGFNEVVRKTKRCNGKPISPEELESLLLKTKRYQSPERWSNLLKPYIEDKILPEKFSATIPEYLVLNDANLVAQHIQTPLYVFHAHDDTVVGAHHWYRFMVAAHGNSRVSGMITSDGGHWGFSAAYGREWVGCVIKTYVDYWSKDKFTLDKKCF